MDDDKNLNNNIHFKGTSILLNDNKVVIIKDTTSDEWTQLKANKDIDKILVSA